MLVKSGSARNTQEVELACHVAPQVPTDLMGDAGRLHQIVANLISNALKFTAKGTVSAEVTLESRTEPEIRLHFKITDTGIGISPEKLGKIFEAFTQADGSTTRQYGGTGLGLTISTRVVEMMGGRIRPQAPAGGLRAKNDESLR
jgi:two-component system sensor histidine kinase/response regulator